MRIFGLLSLILVAQSANAVCVNVAQANLRAQPKVNAKLLWTVGRYMPLLKVKEKGKWLQVKDLEGKKMWISSRLVSDDFDCAVIKVNSSNLRRAPSAKAEKSPLKMAFRYMPFKKLKRDDNWLQLEDAYGGKHWVIDSNVWEPLHRTQLTY